MKALISTGTLALALLLAGCGGSEEGNNASTAVATNAPIAAIPAPNGGEWTEVVSATAEGGFVMGNPDAKVKVVEFASMTCSHCADFAENGLPALTDKYVKSGQVSLEIRNFVRDPADLGAALLARCGGATPYFKLTDQIFASQDEWIGKLQAMPPSMQQQLQSMTPNDAAAAMARQAGLIDFVRVRGVPTEKAEACLADKEELQKLVQMSGTAQSQHQVMGTPSFLINGTLAPETSSWLTLEPKIQAALR